VPCRLTVTKSAKKKYKGKIEKSPHQTSASAPRPPTLTMVQVLDPYYLGITALVTVGYQLTFFFFAAGLKIDTVTDFAGGTNFFALALLTFFLSQVPCGAHGRGRSAQLTRAEADVHHAADHSHGRHLSVGGAPRWYAGAVLWWGADGAGHGADAARHAGFLFWRILKMGKDHRFDDRRENFWAFLVFWVFQARARVHAADGRSRSRAWR
jgi:hypothetical protein